MSFLIGIMVVSFLIGLLLGTILSPPIILLVIKHAGKD